MNKMTLKNNHVTACYIMLLALAAIVFFIFNLHTTLKGDDLGFMYNTVGGELRPVQSLSDFFAALWQQYQDTNGRMADVLSRFVCCIAGKSVFNVLNTLIFVLLLHTLVKRIAGQRSLFALALTLFFILLLIPFPGETMLWICGATNYMWNATFTLLLLNYVASRGDSALRIREAVLLLPAALVAGWMGEIVTLPTAAAMCCYLVLNRRKVNKRHILTFIAYSIGVALILASPAIWARADVELGSQKSVVEMVIGLARRYARFVMPALGLAVLVIAPCVKKKYLKQLISIESLALIISTLMLFVINDTKKDRVYFYVAILGFIIVARFINNLVAQRNKIRVICTSLLVFACIALAFKAHKAIRSYLDFHNQVEQDIRKAGDNCVLHDYKFAPNRWVAVAHYDSQSFNSYYNVYKQYYGKKQIAFLRDESYSQYQKADFLQDATPVPVQSSQPDIIDTIYVLPTTFSIIPIEQQHIDPNGLFMDFDLRKGDNRLTHGTAKNYHLIGALKEHNYLSFFSLQHNDAWYLVIPAVEDDVTHLAIPVIDNGKQVKVDITCNTTQP